MKLALFQSCTKADDKAMALQAARKERGREGGWQGERRAKEERMECGRGCGCLRTAAAAHSVRMQKKRTNTDDGGGGWRGTFGRVMMRNIAYRNE